MGWQVFTIGNNSDDDEKRYGKESGLALNRGWEKQGEASGITSPKQTGGFYGREEVPSG